MLKCPDYPKQSVHSMQFLSKSQWHIFSHKTEVNLAIFNNMDRPWGHYAKWNRLDWVRQILNGTTYMWNLENKQKWKQRKQAHRYREQISGWQRWSVGVGEMGEGGQKVQTYGYKWVIGM